MNTAQQPTRYHGLNWWGHEYDDRTEDGYGKCRNCEAVENTDKAVEICPKAQFIHISVLEDQVGRMVNVTSSKSGKKISKKIQQQFGRQMRRNAEISAKQMMKSFEEHLKPKPKWLPAFLYRKIMRVFIEI